MPADWAAREAGPPKSKSAGVMMASAPISTSCSPLLPTTTGSLAPSRLTKAISSPSSPPLSLNSSIASWMPRMIGSSNGAWMPVRHKDPPIRIPASSTSTSPSTCGAVSSAPASVSASLAAGAAPHAPKASARVPRTANLETVFFIVLLYLSEQGMPAVACPNLQNPAGSAWWGGVWMVRSGVLARDRPRMPRVSLREQRCPQGETYVRVGPGSNAVPDLPGRAVRPGLRAAWPGALRAAWPGPPGRHGAACRAGPAVGRWHLGARGRDRCRSLEGPGLLGRSRDGKVLQPVMSPSPRHATVAVIGAGQAGLSAAYHLQRRGFASAMDTPAVPEESRAELSPVPPSESRPKPGRRQRPTFVVFDAEKAPGGAWQHRWESLRMNTVNSIFDLPGMPVPPVDPEEPSREAVPRYFAHYEYEHDFPILRPVRVHSVRPAGPEPHADLVIETDQGAIGGA